MAGCDQYMSCAVSYQVYRLIGEWLVCICFLGLLEKLALLAQHLCHELFCISLAASCTSLVWYPCLQLLFAFLSDFSLHSALSQEMAISAGNSFMPTSAPTSLKHELSIWSDIYLPPLRHACAFFQEPFLGGLLLWWLLSPLEPGSVGGLEGVLCYTGSLGSLRYRALSTGSAGNQKGLWEVGLGAESWRAAASLCSVSLIPFSYTEGEACLLQMLGYYR